MRERYSYLGGLLVVLHVFLLDIVMRTERFLQIRADDHSWSLRGSTADEQHDATTVVLIGSLQKSNGNTHGYTRAALGALVRGNGPGILLQLFQNRR